MSDFDSNSPLVGSDKEIQEFLMLEKQKAQVNAQVKFIHLYFRFQLMDHGSFFRYMNSMRSAGTNASVSRAPSWIAPPKPALPIVWIVSLTPPF